MVDNMVGENIMEVMEKLKLENGLKGKGLNGLVARKKESWKILQITKKSKTEDWLLLL